MTRIHVALALGVLAVLAVAGTAVLAVSTYVGGDSTVAAEPLVVTDPVSGAKLAVPADGWEVRGSRSRIFYEDGSGRPTAVVSGAAVYRDGYCEQRPGDSNRGFAGFTEQSFASWWASLGGGGNRRREPVVLADGTEALLQWVLLPGGHGPCTADAVELAMVSAGELRVVLVADTGEDGTLGHGEVVRILSGATAS